jgi:hypothetical protein
MVYASCPARPPYHYQQQQQQQLKNKQQELTEYTIGSTTAAAVQL